MKRWVCTVLAMGALTMALAAQAEDKKAEMDPQTMMAMQQAAMPGEHHEHMKALTGEFTYTMSWWMAPGTDPLTSEGKRSAKMIMDGHFLEETYAGMFMGEAFVGRGTMGYDNMAKQYVFTWIDNMTTAIMTSHGTCSKDGGWELKGSSLDPMTGKMVESRSTLTMPDKDTMVMKMYMPGQDGKEFMMGEITCKRAM
jgi:hypothetical protein